MLDCCFLELCLMVFNEHGIGLEIRFPERYLIVSTEFTKNHQYATWSQLFAVKDG